MYDDSATVAAADIARLAGVGRAAVSNWRRRFDDFPSPVGGTSSSPLFSLFDVEDWLRRQGKLAEIPLDERVWQQLRAGVEDLGLADVLGHVGAFLLFLDRYPKKWQELSRRKDAGLSSEEFAEERLPGASRVDITLSLLRAVAELAAERGTTATFDFLYTRYLEAHSRRVATSPAGVADLMVDLVASDGGTVLDPTCGLGTLLLAAASSGAAKVAGQDRDEAVARITAVRLTLHGHDATVHVGDSLRDDRFGPLQADGVVCSPPFGERSWGYEELASDVRWQYGLPPRGEPELPWVQHGLHHVRPGGHVVILMPSAAADRRSGRRIRAQLLRTGTLRGVVTLPVGAAPHALGSPHLWILRKPEAEDPIPSHVLMMDVAELPWPRIRAEVVKRWQAFCASPQVDGAVPLIDLLDEDVDLTPACYVAGGPPDSTGQEFTAAVDAMVASVSALQQAMEELRAFSPDRAELPKATIAEQARAGAIFLQQVPKHEPVSGGLPMLTVEDVIAGREPSGRTAAFEDMVTLRSGDVVVPWGGRTFVARVVREGGAVLGSGLHLLRVDPERVDPACLAGFLRLAGKQTAGRGQSGTSRSDIRRVEIPRLPLSEQRRLGEAFERLERVEEIVNGVHEQGAALVRLGFEGFAGGSLVGI
ncbi:N-6 DNA methylase [Planotetraspora mira]|uniref:Type II restriction endonuclease subunit M n=1 Tax=Planotetraspora mira TaxID=58121 RepID=A0A8J3TTX8_9ACTN|nr:N-6 DNA methylase [Planotetraspora mira]GII30434.1 type II restriction endonuclease subunit M [Planotetraspora mira]